MWTTNQELAINAIGKNITVSASAGAGKTAVLVQRLVKRITQDKVSVDQIVALTFTEAAAAEMKNRLQIELQKLAKQDVNDEYLVKQLTLLPNAKITTIHSFCLSLLKDYYYALGITSDSLNNILENHQIAEAAQTAFNLAVNQSDADKLTVLMTTLYGDSFGLNQLSSLVIALAKNADNSNNPLAWLDNSIKIFNSYSHIKQLPSEFLDLLFDYLSIETQKLKNFLLQLSVLIDNEIIIGNDLIKHRNLVNNGLEIVKLLNSAIESNDYSSYYRNFIILAKTEIPNIAKHAEYGMYRDEYYKLLDNLAAALYSEEEQLQHLANNKFIATTLIDLTKRYHAHYHQQLRTLHGITFDDMEHFTYQLLTQHPDIRQEISSAISDILVDEFQDTNEIQNDIIVMLSNGNNIFRVGDVKQSIYRFRGAKPKIMQELIELGNTDNHQVIVLEHNFRSKIDIVNYNNDLFANLMNMETLNSSYADYDKVSIGTSNQTANSSTVIFSQVSEELNETMFKDKIDNNQLKAYYIAAKIQQLQQQDIELRWNKYTVLVRSHAAKHYLRRAFDDLGIPYFISMPDGFYETAGVSTIISFLKLLVDPYDYISLVAILINLYHHQEDQIAEAYLHFDHDWVAIVNHIQPSLNTLLYELRQRLTSMMLTEIINLIINENNYYESFLSKQERTNVDILFQEAAKYQTGQSGVHGFLLQIEQININKTGEGVSLTADDNVVNVTSFHASKGLQFDTVFVWSNDRRTTNPPGTVLIDDNLGVALKTYDSEYAMKENLATILLKFNNLKEEIEEEMRTLYVALTRAENKMYIVDTYRENDDSSYFDYSSLYSAKGYSKWIRGAQATSYSPHLTIESINDIEYQTSLQAIPITKINKLSTITKADIIKPKYQWPTTPLDFDSHQDGMEIGTMLHRVIERLDGNNISVEAISQLEPNLSQYQIKQISSLSQNSVYQHYLTLEHYHEFPFINLNDNKTSRGIVDFLAIDNNDVYIVDFKSDTVLSADQLIERYSEQMDNYRLAMKQSYPDKEIHTLLYSLHLNEFIPVS